MSNTALQPAQPAPAIRAYLGGSFDPVHRGHVQMAMAVYQSLLPLAQAQQRALYVSLLPNSRSPFKRQSSDPKHRLAMLKLAIQGTPLHIDELEIWQPPPVYTIDSVRTLRQRYPADSLIFIMGMDSARSLDKWQDGLHLTDYVHLWVFYRDTMPVPDTDNDRQALQYWLPTPLQTAVTDSPAALTQPISQPSFIQTPTDPTIEQAALKNPASGRIYIDMRQVATISSTQIRQTLQQQSRGDSEAAPDSAAGNHTKPVIDEQMTAASAINAILNPPDPLAKWLNPAVYHYIIAHQLYSAAQFR